MFELGEIQILELRRSADFGKFLDIPRQLSTMERVTRARDVTEHIGEIIFTSDGGP